MCLQCLFLEMCSTDDWTGGFGFLLVPFFSARAIASSFSMIRASFSSSVGFFSRFARFFFFFFLAAGSSPEGSPPSRAGLSASDGGELGPGELDDEEPTSGIGGGGERCGGYEDDDDEDAIEIEGTDLVPEGVA